MGFVKWESFLEKHIEGFFNKKFSSELEPAEIEKAIGHELERRRKKSRHGSQVPNAYEVCMGEEDYQRLSSRRLLDELYLFIEKNLILTNTFMDGKLHLTFREEASLSLGICTVNSCYEDAVPEGEDMEEPHTLVLNRSSFTLPLNLPTEYKTVSLTAVEGPDMDSYLEFGEKKIYIGRRDKNDFILTDTNASRLHAYIAFERHRHVLYDAKSLNGTFVNDKPITSACLLAGDKIRVGNTVLLYEVI